MRLHESKIRRTRANMMVLTGSQDGLPQRFLTSHFFVARVQRQLSGQHDFSSSLVGRLG